MLGIAYHWLDTPDASYLRYNAKTVAIVRPREVVIRWWGTETGGRCGSIAQGKRYVERWIAARLGKR